MAHLPPSPFTTADAREAGISRQQLRRYVATGRVRRLLHGVYAVAGAVGDNLRAEALAVVLPPGAVVCRASAAWLYGLDLAAPGAPRPATAPVEVLVASSSEPIRRRGVIGYSSVDLQPEDVTTCAGVPVTTPLRTALDCGRLLPRIPAVAAVDALLHSGQVSLDELLDQAARFAGRRNVRQLRWVVDVAEPLTESSMESWTRVRLLDGGLPRPRAQVPIPRPLGAAPYRLDLGYEEQLVGVEYDGAGDHGSLVAQAHDLGRRRWIEDTHGWQVLVATERDVLAGWRQLVDATAEALMARGWTPGAPTICP